METNNKMQATKEVYPNDWTRIATEAKIKADYQCQICHYRQGEKPNIVITVHHKDHNTFNSQPSNLQILCSRCHLRIEGIYHRSSDHARWLKSMQDNGARPFPGMELLLKKE